MQFPKTILTSNFSIIISAFLKIVSSDFQDGIVKAAVQVVSDMQDMIDAGGFDADLTFGKHISKKPIKIEPLLTQIDNYGCWCYFDESYDQGRGMPVNTIDHFCRSLHYGYDCANRDSLGEDENTSECIPWKHPYITGVNVVQLQILQEAQRHFALEDQCIDNNPDDTCAQRACIIEGNFVLDVLQNFLINRKFDPTLNHAHPFNFDPTQNCNVGDPLTIQSSNPLSQTVEIECCGNYPNRKPFKNVNGNRMCCGGKIYNPFVHTCCEDSVGDEKIMLTCSD